ncbi:putative ribonuclease H-like domain-containing protein [Tanacetum coccineum]|uniref:Ribonuclease H-like domain-containing protein n=1 Tax=Tanacetum coccineum TaxID=301880 RepID=A0ABQ4YKU7_9ASTR
MAFVSSPSSTNEVNTAYGVSTTNNQFSPTSTQVSNASTQVSTANLSDDTVYAFLASQPNGSQLVYEDLEKIHEDDIEEMDLKWQLALLSMRTRRGPRNQDSRNRNQHSSRRTINVEETSSKAMVAIDGVGFDWSYIKDDEVPTNMALMAFSDSEGVTGEEPNEEKLLVKELLKLICDKKNSVLFTDNGCFVLSPDFKLADESQVLLKVPRKNNMYNVDIKNIFPSESLTCLVAKPTLDESMLWHSRLGHVKFKTINKLVKENLVRGLPSKCFENDQNYVACLKRKQHRASFVTDDYSRFTWVIFLASKDETSDILKSFITEIENLVNKKVKIIRCDNGTEFKNRAMSDFCEKKGIKREFSIARTPQQNGVAERRNMTLIEAARTIGRKPALSFMRPFGCHVIILNTLDYLGKFDGKLDEEFFVGYSLNSKAFRVYNIRTRKVEENLHIWFLENKPIIAGDGLKWLFDIDVLTKSMNYVPVVAGTNSNDSVDGSLFDSSSKNASNDELQSSSDARKKDDEGVSQESGIDDQERLENSTQDVNTVGTSINNASTNVNTSSLNINTVSPTVATALLKATHADFFGDETELHMSNITTTYLVPSTPNTRIHKDHSLDHVISDV